MLGLSRQRDGGLSGQRDVVASMIHPIFGADVHELKG